MQMSFLSLGMHFLVWCIEIEIERERERESWLTKSFHGYSSRRTLPWFIYGLNHLILANMTILVLVQENKCINNSFKCGLYVWHSHPWFLTLSWKNKITDQKHNHSKYYRDVHLLYPTLNFRKLNFQAVAPYFQIQLSSLEPLRKLKMVLQMLMDDWKKL